MNRILKISTVLTWINMIFWGLGCLLLLLGVLASGMFTMSVLLVFPSAVVLHSYAVFQLHKSIRNPAVPLNSQTPTGIRFIGFVAMFVGISDLFAGINCIQNAPDILKQLLNQGPQLKDLHVTAGQVRALGVFVLLIGLSVAVNVNLNFRLLRWYYFLRDSNKEK